MHALTAVTSTQKKLTVKPTNTQVCWTAVGGEGGSVWKRAGKGKIGIDNSLEKLSLTRAVAIDFSWEALSLRCEKQTCEDSKGKVSSEQQMAVACLSACSPE